MYGKLRGRKLRKHQVSVNLLIILRLSSLGFTLLVFHWIGR